MISGHSEIFHTAVCTHLGGAEVVSRSKASLPFEILSSHYRGYCVQLPFRDQAAYQKGRNSPGDIRTVESAQQPRVLVFLPSLDRTSQPAEGPLSVAEKIHGQAARNNDGCLQGDPSVKGPKDDLCAGVSVLGSSLCYISAQ